MTLPTRLLLLIIPIFTFVTAVVGQDALPGCIEMEKVGLSRNISPNVSSAFVDADLDIRDHAFKPGFFTPGIQYKGRIPTNVVPRKAVLRFSACNNADSTVSNYFFPGFYYRSIKLYRQRGNYLERLPDILPDFSDSIGYREISLAANDSATFIIELSFVKTYINTLRPRLVNPSYVRAFRAEMQSTNSQNDLVTYVFCGLLLMMILYSLANFLQGANPEFLYYSGYAFFIGLMLFTKAMFTFKTSTLSYFLEDYLDFIMQALGIIFYMIFMQKYLDTKKNYPSLFRLYNTGIRLLIFAMAAYTWFHYFTANFSVENAIENITKFLLLVLTIIFLIYGLRFWKDKQLRYLFQGNLFLFVFGFFSMLIIIVPSIDNNLPGLFGSSLFYYELGLFLELVFFLMALNYKNRKQLIAQARERERLKAENQMKEYEKDLAVFRAQQAERERISADMHDELGSGMTAIRLMSEIAMNKMKQERPVEIERISQSADEVLNKMNAIIWSMNSENDTVDNLVSYIRSYALEYFENTHITCKVNTPDNIEKKELTGDKRRNIFLSVKETLNNALKHSKASVLTIDFVINNELCIRIADNGVGIDKLKIRHFGNGLKNIARRMDSIGGTYRIDADDGTVTLLTLPL